MKLCAATETKPAVLVVLHHTSDPEATVPDSSRSVDRGNTLTVDCLFHEDRGLLQCYSNQRALEKVTQWIKPQAGTPGHKSPCERPDSTGPVPQREGGESEPAAAENAESEAGGTTNIKSEADRGAGTGAEATGTADLKFLSCVSGKTLGSDEGFIRKLIDGIPGLKEVSTVEECDVILAFCPVASRAGTDIESALKKLQQLSETKPAVLLVLHHTSDPEATVPDSSRSVDRGNTLTVDCLFHEDRGLLQCYSNQRALEKVTQWIKPQAGTPGHKSPGERPDSTGPVPQREGGESEPAAAENAESEAGGTTNIKSEADRGAGTGAEATGTAGDLKFLSCVSGKTLGSDEGFIRKLIDGKPGLKEVSTVEECDVILAFCPVASRAGTDIESALKKLQQLSETKPAVLLVLHHTSDPEATVPDSSRSVDRGNTLTVDCLFHEDRGLLQCYRNQRALKKVTQWIKPQAGTPGHKSPGERPDSTGPVPQREGGESEPAAAENAESEAGGTTNIKSEADRGAGTGAEATGTAGDLKFLSCVSGKTLGSDEGFIRKLIDGKPGLKEVSTVEECDVILAFCPVASRAGTDIESALKKLQQLSETKPAVLLVLHHTSDPEATVPDSSRSVDRGNTLTVDCLFQEDRGLLQCSRNQRALEKVTQWIKPQAGTPGHKSPGERPDSTGPVPQREGGESEPAAAENAESEAGGTTNIKSEADRGAGTGAEATGTAGDLKFLSCVSGKTLGSDEGFIRKLIDGKPGLKEVSTVEECDVILAFCPVASRAGTDIESALKKLQQLSGSSCVLSLKL
ncbi:uncharacterized protein [Salminus brasiliensis]|uniref:uncharacterized protein isoform X2 n=1 Tax=Salminus brasiliensis TaxID=930266 RepID=UPI003B830DEA